MKTALEWAKLIGAILVTILLGEIPAVKEAAAALDTNRAWLLPLAIGIGMAGIVLLVWGMAGVAAKEGHAMTREEYEQLSARAQIQAPGKRYSKAWFRGRHKGVVVPESEWRLADLKAAFRDGTWWRDPAMRAKVLATAGGLLFALGFFGVFVVLIAAPAVKLLLVLALLYAVVQVARAFRRADPPEGKRAVDNT